MLLSTNFKNTIEDAAKYTSVKKLKNPLEIESPKNLRLDNRLSTLLGKRDKPYDFTESYRCLDTEAFVAASISKKKNLILKDGFKLESKNKKYVDYLEKRLNEISFVTETPFNSLLETITASMVTNHNVFLLVQRKEDSSSGVVKKVGAKKLKPIAGYYFLSETKVDLIENNFDNVVGYKYNIKRGIYNEFKKEDILHLTVDKKPDLNVGTPPIEPVKDDIISLRQIEQMLEKIIYKLSMPLMHAKVGTDNSPASINPVSGRLEIEEVSEQLMYIDDTGGMTTTHRVDLKLLGSESLAIRLTPYLDHFKNRVLVGLSTSDLDLGTGTTTTGGAASIVSEALRQNVEMYQYILENFITDYILTPLLLEHPENEEKWYLEEDSKVYFKFNKTHLDTKVKIESHLINEVNSKLITVDEYRTLTGRKPFTPSQRKEVAEFNEKDAPGSSTNPTSNYTNPTNQHSVQDDLKVSRYIKNLVEGREAIAEEILSKEIVKATKDTFELSIEDSLMLVKPLTSSLKNYILGNIKDHSLLNNAVRNVIYNNVLGFIEQKNLLEK